MSFFTWLGIRRTISQRGRQGSKPQPTCQLQVELLEDRLVPANYSAGTVAELIAAMNAANLTAEADTIALVAGTTYTLTEVNNTTNGATGLPTIAATEDLTVVGNGGVIERSTANETPAFRLFDVAAGARLILENVTVQGGLAKAGLGTGSATATGGGILNQGTLMLTGVTVQNNIATGGIVFDGYYWRYPTTVAGGGIWSGGSLTIEGGSVRNNQALGATFIDPFTWYSYGGGALGGGLYISGGTADLTGFTLIGNTAKGGWGGDGLSYKGERGVPGRIGGDGGPGGYGFGGGLYAAGGTISLRGVSVTANSAEGGEGGQAGGGKFGQPGPDGLGIGGGLYIESDALVVLDAFTLSHFKRNKASTSDPDIAGPYTLGS